jgi:hypothetical protein
MKPNLQNLLGEMNWPGVGFLAAFLLMLLLLVSMDADVIDVAFDGVWGRLFRACRKRTALSDNR